MFALTFEYNGMWYKATSEITARVTASQGNPYTGDISIPETVTFEGLTMTVNAIGQGAFSGDSLLTSLFIPKTVQTIGNFSFEGCFSLSEISVSPDNAYFAACDGVLYSKNMDSLLVCPGGRKGEFIVPEGVIYIDLGAFFSTRDITLIHIPSTVSFIEMTGIPKYEDDLDGGAGENTIVIELEASSFNSPALQGFVIDSNNPIYAFENNCLIKKNSNSILKILGQIPQHLVIPNGITKIEDAACRSKDNLLEITFPSFLEHIGANAFAGCFQLKKLNFPQDSKLQVIEEQAFSSQRLEPWFGLASHLIVNVLDSVSIPGSVRRLGSNICATKILHIEEGLEEFDWQSFGYYTEKAYLPSTIRTIDGTMPGPLSHLEIAEGGPYRVENNVLFNSDMSILYNCIDVHGSYKIPNSVSTISPNAFSSKKNITELIVPGSVKVIPDFMCDNSMIERLVLEEGVEEIRQHAFYKNAIRSIVLPSSLKRIEDETCFWFCDNIIEVYDFTRNRLSDNIAELASAPIKHYCNEPSSIQLTPDGFVYYKKDEQIYLAGYCGESSDVVMPDYIEDQEYIYSENLFSICPRIKHLTLPNNKSIFDFTGSNFQVNSVEKVTIPEGATIEGQGKNVFHALTAEIELNPNNPFMCYENGVLYDKAKTLMIAYNNRDDSVFIMPETVSKVCPYVCCNTNNDHSFHNIRYLYLSENLKQLPAYSFWIPNIKEIVIPDEITIEERGGPAIYIGSYSNDSINFELGAGSYCPSPIIIGLQERAIIKCNFNNPNLVQCPFQDKSGSLHVPYGTKQLFASASDWSLFDNIEETFDYNAPKHAVIYKIDGVVYRIDSVPLLSAITLPNAPQKNGYKFDGWKNVPQVMMFEDVVVESFFYKLGDVNDDTKVNIIDINETLNIIYSDNIDSRSKRFLSADANEDKWVDVADIFGIVDIIMNGSLGNMNYTQKRRIMPNISNNISCKSKKNEKIQARATFNQERDLSIAIQNPNLDIVSLQFDLILPKGVQYSKEDMVAPLTLSNYHTFDYKQMNDSTLRVVYYSSSNKPFDTDCVPIGNVTIKQECTEEVDYLVNFRNVIIVYKEGQTERGDCSCIIAVEESSTSIETHSSDHNKFHDTIYELSGKQKKESSEELKGLSIVNGKVVLIR